MNVLLVYRGIRDTHYFLFSKPKDCALAMLADGLVFTKEYIKHNAAAIDFLQEVAEAVDDKESPLHANLLPVGASLPVIPRCILSRAAWR